jgi:protease YdgD
MRLALIFLLLFPLGGLQAQESPLRQLQTSDESRDWNAVGRLNLGQTGFCTGTLISPKLVLTAAHCLFDKDSSAQINPDDIEFLAGWRNGRAAAYRSVRRAVIHPDYTFDAEDRLDRVAHDLALLELDQPIRLPSITPFSTDTRSANGDEVGVVSYAMDRAEAPSLQQLCHVLGQQPGVFVLSCNVDFGSSGAPIFSFRDGVARIVSVVSAKAEVKGQKVALGVALEQPLAVLMAALDRSDPAFRQVDSSVRSLSGSGGAKFIRP